jgi:PBP1b-binding outer membrane lipoprotein LpoB
MRSDIYLVKRAKKMKHYILVMALAGISLLLCGCVGGDSGQFPAAPLPTQETIPTVQAIPTPQPIPTAEQIPTAQPLPTAPPITTVEDL